MAHPTHVKFPGTVRFAPKPSRKPAPGEPAEAWQEPKDENGKPIRATVMNDEKGRFQGTLVVCPPGKRFAYVATSAPAAYGPRGRPSFLVTMVDDPNATVAHAELEHVAATELDRAHVKATSTKHEGVSAVGATAADAVRFLGAAVKDHERESAAADAARESAAADAEAKKKAAEAKDAADVAEELHKSKPPPEHADGELVERHG